MKGLQRMAQTSYMDLQLPQNKKRSRIPLPHCLLLQTQLKQTKRYHPKAPTGLGTPKTLSKLQNLTEIAGSLQKSTVDDSN